MLLAGLREKIAYALFPEGRDERRSLQRQADMDELTGLGNKRALMRALPSAEADKDLRVAVFDMNNLGKANKIAGHKEGDRLIRRAARTIQINASYYFDLSYDHRGVRAFRFGGDEFVVIAHRDIIKELVSGICASFGQFTFENVTVSMSGAYGLDFKAADEIIQAQKAMDKMAYV